MIKRSISENHLNRLEAQLEEAKLLKLTKIAESLESQIDSNKDNVRHTDHYIYTDGDLKNDVNNNLWAAAMRMMDYLGEVPDARNIQKIIDKYASELFNEVCVASNVSDGVGAYDTNVPGEARDFTSLEVNEND